MIRVIDFNVKCLAYVRDTTDWMAVNPPKAIAVTIRLLVHNSMPVSDHPEVHPPYPQTMTSAVTSATRVVGAWGEQSTCQKEDGMDE